MLVFKRSFATAIVLALFAISTLSAKLAFAQIPPLTATPTNTATHVPTATGTPTATLTPPIPTIVLTATPTLIRTPTATPVPRITPAPGGLAVEPSPRLLNFGMVGIMETSPPRDLVLHNGTTATVTGAASITPPYKITPPTVDIPARGAEVFMLTFAPTAQGQQNTTANFALAPAGAVEPSSPGSAKTKVPTVMRTPEPELMVPVEGFGAPGNLTIQHRLVNFGKRKNPSQAQLMQTDELGNDGRGVLTINIGTLAPPFSVSPTGSKTIAPHGTPVQLTIKYSGGSSKQTLTITTDNPNPGRSSETIAVEGDDTFTEPTVTPTASIGATIVSTSIATPTATFTPPAVAKSGSPLFAGQGLAGAMVGPSISPKSQALGSLAHIYDPATDSFRQVGKMNSPRVGAASITLPNGMTLIAGGGRCVEGQDKTRSCTASNTAQLFNPNTRKFSTAGTGSKGQMNAARMGHSATLISGCNCPLDGDVLLAGGNSGLESVSPDRAASDAPPLQSAELYDYRNDSFIAITSQMITPREEAIASAIPGNGGKILIAGGDSKGIFQNSIADAEIFDPVTQTFAATAPMSLSRELARAVALDPSAVNGPLAGDILVAGGLSTVGNLAGTSLSSAELYDAVAGTWKQVAAQMESPRVFHSMTLLSSGPDAGQVLMIGGALLQGSGGLKNLTRNSVASAELFNPADGTFNKVASMSAPRSAHSAVVLGSGPNSGNLLVAGGQNCDGAECAPAASVAELYDPITGKWNPSNAIISHSLGAVLGEVVPVP